MRAKASGLDAHLLQSLGRDALTRLRMPLLEALKKCPSVQLSLVEMLALLPAMKQRLYSISSSSRAAPDRLGISVGVVAGASPSGRWQATQRID